MFAIGRLNGNNLVVGSVEVTTSQLYTGILLLPRKSNGIGLFVVSVPVFFLAKPVYTRVFPQFEMTDVPSFVACRSCLRPCWRPRESLRHR